MLKRGLNATLNRFEIHLLKEHRYRRETPGLPFFDKIENELSGQSLSDARMKAKSTRPMPPSLDNCHLRVEKGAYTIS